MCTCKTVRDYCLKLRIEFFFFFSVGYNKTRDCRIKQCVAFGYDINTGSNQFILEL